jgi:hypothetical protein
VQNIQKTVSEITDTPSIPTNNLKSAYTKALDYLYNTIRKHIKPCQRPPKKKQTNIKRKKRDNKRGAPDRQSLRNCTHTITALILLIARWECQPHRNTKHIQTEQNDNTSQLPQGTHMPTHLLALHTICSRSNNHIIHTKNEATKIGIRLDELRLASEIIQDVTPPPDIQQSITPEYLSAWAQWATDAMEKANAQLTRATEYAQAIAQNKAHKAREHTRRAFSKGQDAKAIESLRLDKNRYSSQAADS